LPDGTEADGAGGAADVLHQVDGVSNDDEGSVSVPDSQLSLGLVNEAEDMATAAGWAEVVELRGSVGEMLGGSGIPCAEQT